MAASNQSGLTGTAMKHEAWGLIVLLCTALAGCDTYVAQDRYATLADAQAEGVFERGWLPDLLPQGSIEIRTVNNLDANTSTGSFRFPRSEGPRLFESLADGVPTEAPFSDWSDTIAKYKRRGYGGWSYRNNDAQWAFFCLADQGVCEYASWPR